MSMFWLVAGLEGNRCDQPQTDKTFVIFTMIWKSSKTRVKICFFRISLMLNVVWIFYLECKKVSLFSMWCIITNDFVWNTWQMAKSVLGDQLYFDTGGKIRTTLIFQLNIPFALSYETISFRLHTNRNSNTSQKNEWIVTWKGVWTEKGLVFFNVEKACLHIHKWVLTSLCLSSRPSEPLWEDRFAHGHCGWSPRPELDR